MIYMNNLSKLLNMADYQVLLHFIHFLLFFYFKVTIDQINFKKLVHFSRISQFI